MVCAVAWAHPYLRYDNPVTCTLEAESALLRGADTPQQRLRVAVGDNAANAPIWAGEKPLPAEQVADLLPLSMAAGSCRADDWFTNEDGSVIVFVARPGVGAKHYVFSVFALGTDGSSYTRVGTYHFISRHLHIRWEDCTLGFGGLTIVATSPRENLRVSKRFDFADKADTFCAYDSPEEVADMGDDTTWNGPSKFISNTQRAHKPNLLVTRLLRDAAAFDFGNGDAWAVAWADAFAKDFWKTRAPISFGEMGMLYLAGRSEVPIRDWIADESGDTLVLITNYVSGCNSYSLYVYRRVKNDPRYLRHWQFAGVYHICSRFLDWDIAATRFEQDGLYVEMHGYNNRIRKGKKFLYSEKKDSFDYLTEWSEEPTFED